MQYSLRKKKKMYVHFEATVFDPQVLILRSSKLNTLTILSL